MIKFQNANVNKTSCPHDVIEYTYIGLKAELDDFNAHKKALENEFWFCPDTEECYYWNKDAQQFLLLGTGYSPEPPPATKLDTPRPTSTDYALEWESVENADSYICKTYSPQDELVDTFESLVKSMNFEEAVARLGTGGPWKTEVIAHSNSTEYSDSDPSDKVQWVAEDPELT